MKNLLFVFMVFLSFAAGFLYAPDRPEVYKIDEVDENLSNPMNYTGVITTNDYVFKFEDLKGNVLGRAVPVEDGRDIIQINSGQSIGEAITTCNHELLHHEFDYWHKTPLNPVEDPIYRMDEYLTTPVCNYVIWKAKHKAYKS